MTASHETLGRIAGIIRDELPKYLSPDFTVNEVQAVNRPGPDDEEFVQVIVILEDGHPEIDARRTLEFNSDMRTFLEQAGIDHPPNISYADRSEITHDHARKHPDDAHLSRVKHFCRSLLPH